MYKGCNIKIIRKKIKNTYIRVKDGEVVVTTNYLTPKIYIMKLIKDNSDSIDKMIDKDKKRLESDNDFYLFGVKYDIIYDDSVKDIVINNNNIVVENEIKLNKYLDNLKIRKMTSRWGVCNTKNNNVTLNYYLYKYDMECLDYVIVHELSHFLEGNHSKKFWEVVSRYYPNYKEVRKKLRS